MPDSIISKAFLSHNSLDKPVVEVIKGLLERGDRPIPCWLDKTDLRSKGTWMSQLEEVIAGCDSAVVFFGPEGRGPVHRYEVELLLQRAMYERGPEAIRLVSVLLPGATKEAVQGFMKLHMWADFRSGLDDAAALQQLRALILGEAPTSGPGDPKTPNPKIEPYRGLESFEGKHANYFLGRDQEIKDLCRCLDEWPFTAVIGGSGSGKSSLAKAGLQTELARKQRPTLAQSTIIVLRPGSDPIRSLANQVAASRSELSDGERLRLENDLDEQFRARKDGLLNGLRTLYSRDDQPILLIIDQFEELFTHSSTKRSDDSPIVGSSSGDNQSEQFVSLLENVAQSRINRLRIVITLRMDFLGQCVEIPALKDLIGDRAPNEMIQNRTLLLGNLSEKALREVIEEPARKVNAYFEKGLVARILQDVENQNGSLPLLQYALKELWDKRHYGFLTNQGYDETGGVENALKERANATLKNLTPDQREIAKNVFLRLTTLGEGVSDTRRRVPKNELYPEKIDPHAIDEVLGSLSSYNNRLVVVNDDGTVEVTHEALIQRWDVLKGWLNENRDDKRLHDRLRDAANEWADPRHGRDSSYLWEGGRLDLAERFHEVHPNVLTALEREFLGASILKREEEESQKEEARREQLARQEELANAQAERARLAEQSAAEARDNALRQGWLKRIGFIVAGVALAAAFFAGWQTWSASAAKQTAQRQQAAAHRENADFYWRLAAIAREDEDHLQASYLFLRGTQALTEIVPSQKSKLDKNRISNYRVAASMGDSSLVRTWVFADYVDGTQLSQDGSRVLTWTSKKALLWDVNKSDLLQTFEQDDKLHGAELNRDATSVLTWSSEKAQLWDVNGPRLIQTFRHQDGVYGAQFSNDTWRILTWGADKTAKLWDTKTIEPLATFNHGAGVNRVHQSLDGSRLLISAGYAPTLLWNAADPQTPQTFKDVEAQDGQFTRDGAHVLTWSVRRRDARLSNVNNGELIRVFEQDEAVSGAAFSQDESQVLTWSNGDYTSDKGEARLWSVIAPKPIHVFKHSGKMYGSHFSRDELYVLTWSMNNNTAKVWEMNRREALQTFKHTMVSDAQFSADGARVLTRGGGTAQLWKVNKSELLHSIKHDNNVSGAHVSMDESRLLTWSQYKMAWLWDMNTLELLYVFRHDNELGGAVLSRDASRILIWSSNRAFLWDAKKFELIQTFEHDDHVNGARFSDDELRVLTWGAGKTVKMWGITEPAPLATFEHDSFVSGAQFNRHATHVLTWSDDKTARLWNTINKSMPTQAFKHEGRLNGAQFNRDESLLLTWSDDKTVKLWDVTSPEPLRTFKHDGNVYGAQFSPDESRVLTRSEDQTARLWDAANTEVLQIFKHESAVRGAQFSRDGSRVLTWSEDPTVKLWDAAKSYPIQAFNHSSVNGAQFSQDGSRLLTWGNDGTARLWDVGKPEPIRVFNHTGTVTGAQFIRNELQVLTWGHDNTAKMWDISEPLELLSPTERILELEVRSGTTLNEKLNVRVLTFDEWQAKAKSPEYQAIEKKLQARTEKAGK